LLTFGIPHASLPLTVAKLSTFKNGPVFWPTLYIAVNSDVVKLSTLL